MTENPYVEYELLDPETDVVIGKGKTLKSTVDYLAAGGQKVRIVTVLTPETETLLDPVWDPEEP